MNDNAGNTMKRAFFPDRDGVIIEQVESIRARERGCRIAPAPPDAARLLLTENMAL